LDLKAAPDLKDRKAFKVTPDLKVLKDN